MSVAAALLVLVPALDTKADVAGGLEFVGNVDLVDEKGDPYSSVAERPRIIGLNKASGDLLVVEVWKSTLASVDPVSLKQTGLVPLGGPFDFTSSAASVYDDAIERLFYSDFPCPGQPCAVQGRLRVYSVARPEQSFTVTLPPATAGENVVALQTVEVGGRHLLYVLLHQSACCALTSLMAPARNTLLVVDIAAMKPDTLLTPLWSYDLPPECDDFPVRNPAYLGIARDNTFAYFLCLGQLPPGQKDIHSTPHLAMVVDFKSGSLERQSPPAFETSSTVFPGILPKGLTIGDRRGERVMALIANGQNNQLYVFDGRHRAWIGSVPLSGNTNLWGGAVDSETGRIYVVQEGRSALVTEGARLPIPQGQEHDLGVTPQNGEDYPFFEPKSRRLFVLGPGFRRADGGEEFHSLRVYRDTTPPSPPRVDADPDEGTNDVPEVAGKTPMTFTGGASAYGARLSLVGGFANSQAGSYIQQLNTTFAGISGIAAAVCGAIPPGSPSQFNEACGISGPPQISGNDRIVTLGRIEDAQLTDSAATATAAGAVYDEATRSDLHNFGLEEAVAGNVPETVPSQCGDTSGQKAAREQPGSAVVCDLAREQVAATAASDRQAAAGGPRIGSAHATTRIERGSRGVVAVTEAVARDIDLPIPTSVLKASCAPIGCPPNASGGRIHIDEVRNTARTTARGRPGSAQTTVTPALRGVTVFDNAGAVLYSCGECDPHVVASRVRAVSPDMLGVTVPPRLGGRAAATPKGAQALALKDTYAYWNDRNINNDASKEAPALQFIYYNDSDRPSRLVVQLAGVLAESHYTVGLPAVDVPTTPGDPGFGGTGGDAGTDLCGSGAACAVQAPDGFDGDGGRRTGPGASGGIGELLGGFLRRSMGQALLLTLVWLLLGTPAYLTYRRRSLLSMQQEEAFT